MPDIKLKRYESVFEKLNKKSLPNKNNEVFSYPSRGSAYLIEAIGPFIIIEFLAFFICQFLPKISNIIFNFKPIHIILLSVSIKIIVILESLIYYQIEKIFFRIFKFQIAPSISLIFIYIFFLYCLLIFFSIRFICYSIKKIKKINLLEKYECSDCSFRIAYFDSNCKNCNEKLV